MHKIRLADPTRHDGRRLAFGSSEWAADSCLAEWSQFEREWLGPDPRSGRAAPASGSTQSSSPFAAACAGVAAGVCAMIAWNLLGSFWLS